MRLRIVEHLMLTWQHHGLAAPSFDPVNFDFVFHGRANDIFAALAEERAFERERDRDRLVREGILKIDLKTVRLASPGAEAVTSHAVWSRVSKAKDWLENDPASAGDTLHEALSLIGVRRARDIAEALLAYGDKKYMMTSGPLRDVLSKIASDGDLDVFVHALNVFSYVLPGSARELSDAVPAKILNQFVARNRQVPIACAFRWMQVNLDWADTLRAKADRPASFTLTVNAMVEQMRVA